MSKDSYSIHRKIIGSYTSYLFDVLFLSILCILSVRTLFINKMLYSMHHPLHVTWSWFYIHYINGLEVWVPCHFNFLGLAFQYYVLPYFMVKAVYFILVLFFKDPLFLAYNITVALSYILPVVAFYIYTRILYDRKMALISAFLSLLAYSGEYMSCGLYLTCIYVGFIGQTLSIAMYFVSSTLVYLAFSRKSYNDEFRVFLLSLAGLFMGLGILSHSTSLIPFLLLDILTIVKYTLPPDALNMVIKGNILIFARKLDKVLRNLALYSMVLFFAAGISAFLVVPFVTEHAYYAVYDKTYDIWALHYSYVIRSIVLHMVHPLVFVFGLVGLVFTKRKLLKYYVIILLLICLGPQFHRMIFMLLPYGEQLYEYLMAMPFRKYLFYYRYILNLRFFWIILAAETIIKISNKVRMYNLGPELVLIIILAIPFVNHILCTELSTGITGCKLIFIPDHVEKELLDLTGYINENIDKDSRILVQDAAGTWLASASIQPLSSAVSSSRNIASSFMFTLPIFAERNYVGPYPPVDFIVTEIVDTENNLFFGRYIGALSNNTIMQYLDEIGVNYVITIKNTAYDKVLSKYLTKKYENSIFSLYVFNKTSAIDVSFKNPRLISILMYKKQTQARLKIIYYRSWKTNTAKIEPYLTGTQPQLPFMLITGINSENLTLEYETPPNVKLGIAITCLTFTLETLLVIYTILKNILKFQIPLGLGR